MDGRLNTDGAELYYQVHGQGPALVLAHGIGGNHAIWYRQLGPLARANTVITFDHRGFGLSLDKDGRGRSAFVDDLEALLDHLAVDRVALIGQSMGAGTCIGFAARHPARVAALVIADSLHGLTEPEDVAPLMDAARTATASLSQIERVLGGGAEAELAQLYRQIASFNQTDRHSLKGSLAPITPAALAALGLPIMFIAGMDDRLFPIEAIRAMQAHVPGSFLVEVTNAGHSAFLEQPIQVNDSILTLLQMTGHVGKGGPAHSNAQGYVRVE